MMMLDIHKFILNKKRRKPLRLSQKEGKEKNITKRRNNQFKADWRYSSLRLRCLP
jgi:hypothetical protein